MNVLGVLPVHPRQRLQHAGVRPAHVNQELRRRDHVDQLFLAVASLEQACPANPEHVHIDLTDLPFTGWSEFVNESHRASEIAPPDAICETSGCLLRSASFECVHAQLLGNDEHLCVDCDGPGIILSANQVYGIFQIAGFVGVVVVLVIEVVY